MKRIKILISLVVIATFVLALMPTASALADQPTKTNFPVSQSTAVIDNCSFPVTVDMTVYITETEFYDYSGALIRSYFHLDEQDTFTANGKNLVGIPYKVNIEMLFDSNGVPTHSYADGIIEKIPLPDGSLFISAGRVDFVAHGFPAFLLSPDKGNPGNMAGFCAALAP